MKKWLIFLCASLVVQLSWAEDSDVCASICRADKESCLRGASNASFAGVDYWYPDKVTFTKSTGGVALPYPAEQNLVKPSQARVAEEKNNQCKDDYMRCKLQCHSQVGGERQ
jgi:hypothetical protein